VVPVEQEVVLEQVGCDRLVAFLDAVPDRRKRRGRQYRLSYLLAAAVVAMMAADLQLTSIGEWGATAAAALLIALGARVDRWGAAEPPGCHHHRPRAGRGRG
jgi:DDE_Tnp_1-associated